MARVSAHTKEATRTKLLEAAASEFGRVGLERANVDAISLAAGRGKGTVYNYFPSKEELFLAVVGEASARATAAVGPADPDAPAWDKLHVTLGKFCTWVQENEPLARVLVRECLMGTPGLYPRVIGAEAPLVGELTALLAEGADRGEVRADLPPETLALAIAGMADLCLVYHWATNGATPTLAEIPDLVLRLSLGAPATTVERP